LENDKVIDTEEKEQRSKENRRKATDRRKSSITEITDFIRLNLGKPDSRSEPSRRSGKDRRTKKENEK
jgi:hypothetical protein